MSAEDSTQSSGAQSQQEPPVWTYPTRFCRICREDVPATVTMYPPGLPVQFQKPVVEYKNEDEYGRLIKPCMCRGSLRYIHELCLLRSRTENRRSGSMWKCHECGHQFNFKRLTAQRYLSSKVTITALTMAFMILVVFALGFIADPIINVYMDPYDSIVHQELWEELEVRSSSESPVSDWVQHFAKGFISMGLVGFLKTLILNPFQWINLRMGSSWTTTRATTGRDRAVNISWIAVVIGVCSAFVLFYRWVQAIVQRTLQRIGNNIVDTQLSGDDDDLKPPPGWKSSAPDQGKAPDTPSTNTEAEAPTAPPTASQYDNKAPADSFQSVEGKPSQSGSAVNTSIPESILPHGLSAQQQEEVAAATSSTPLMSGSWVSVDSPAGEEGSHLPNVHRQGWSFSNL